jgi:stage V sporulation protein AC
MMSAALEYRREGMVTGLGASMFKLAGSVIIFGVVSAYLFGLLRIIIMGG